MTALHLAAEGGHYECIRLLLEAGCSVNELTHVRTLVIMQTDDRIKQCGFQRSVQVKAHSKVSLLIE